jgi:hypothetical protein
MDALSITELTEAQFVTLAKDTTHRVALHTPSRWLWSKARVEFFNNLIISTRYIDKENPSARLPFATRVPIEEGLVQQINLLWNQNAKWCLLETHIAGSVKYQHLELDAKSKYKMVSLTVKLDNF